MPQSSSTASTVTATLAVLAGGLAAFHTVKKLRKKPRCVRISEGINKNEFNLI
jgi:uncharacterized membrane protein YdjX (TVP38/TMEM64 family)